MLDESAARYLLAELTQVSSIYRVIRDKSSLCPVAFVSKQIDFKAGFFNTAVAENSTN